MSVIVGWIVAGVLNWVEAFFAKFISDYELAKKSKEQNSTIAAKDNEAASKINTGSTSSDIDKAGDDSTNHT